METDTAADMLFGRSLEKDIPTFLKRFHDYNDVDTTFTHGCCYWFAMILMLRFANYHPQMMYDQIDNHFGVKLGEKVYDITGDITTKYNMVPWNSISDIALKARILRDCVNF